MSGAAAFVAFGRFDMGALLSREGRTVKCVRFLIDEREDGTHLSYDLMADYLLPYENAVASKTARLSRSSSTKRLEGGVHFGGRTQNGPRSQGRRAIRARSKVRTRRISAYKSRLTEWSMGR